MTRTDPPAGAERFVPERHELGELAGAVQACRGCDLYEHATQAVFGRGGPDSRMLLVGEQPGDVEDRAGEPFVGPAGKLLDRALADAGIERRTAYLTNAVKHFRFAMRGTRRIHDTPSTVQVVACRPWLLAELDAVTPEVVVVLGATAARSLLGPRFRVTRQRGTLLDWPADLATEPTRTTDPPLGGTARPRPARGGVRRTGRRSAGRCRRAPSFLARSFVKCRSFRGPVPAHTGTVGTPIPTGTGGAVDVWDGLLVAETERLRLRTFCRADLPSYAALNCDPAVIATLGGTPLTRDDTEELAQWHQERYAADGYGLLAVERRADGAFLGMCGLHHQRSFPDDVELAYRLSREHWGHGYATEAGAAWLALGFERFGLPRVIGITDDDNGRSLAVMHRLGMTLCWRGPVTDGGETFEAVVHEITAARWRAGR